MNIDRIREAHRKAGAELVADLGYDPGEVSMDSELGGRTAVVKVVLRDAEGKVKVQGHEVVTRIDRVRTTAAQRARYRATVRRESEGA